MLASIASLVKIGGLSKNRHVVPSASTSLASTQPGCGSLDTHRTTSHLAFTSKSPLGATRSFAGPLPLLVCAKRSSAPAAWVQWHGRGAPDRAVRYGRALRLSDPHKSARAN